MDGVLILLFSLGFSGVALGSPLYPPECPRECTCEVAPLRAASFVLTWMTSWGEDDLPEIHPNEVTEAGDLVTSSTAEDAGVDVDVMGLHATCALMPDTNLTRLFHALPSNTMVLTVLQAVVDELVVVEAGQLTPLKELKALHLQGYGRRRATQVSGYFPNRVLEMVEHKERLSRMTDEENQDLLLAISEDALVPLTNLQLLDLQYVRLVAAVEGGRLRRQIEPLSTTTLLDMPLPSFLSFTDQLQNLNLPPDLLDDLTPSSPVVKVEFEPLNDDENTLVPYEVFKTEAEVVLAPFMAQTQLRYLRVAHAKLDRVGYELLTGLANLHTLTLEHNHIKVLPTAMFTPAPHIRHLSLAHNNILALEGDSLAGLEELLTLDLDHNKLDIIGPATFPSLPRVASLRLLGNPLTHVFPFAFANVNATEKLLLGSRQVSAEAHIDTFRQLGLLTKLQIENTTLLALSRLFLVGMPNLRELTIHGHVPSIDYDAFTATPNLESLTLSNCHLSRLSLDSFLGLRSLRYLDLSHNKLTQLSPGTFDYLSSLRELYLHHNQLTTLPPGIFLTLPAKLVQLHENPWHCTCELLQMQPTITNKVRERGYTTCRWDEKQGTVCTDQKPVRVRYDSRVAPLCTTPLQHRRYDVFHVTSRLLKCPKHLWAPPRPTPRLRRVEPLMDNKSNRFLDEKVGVLLEKEEPSWLPLTAHTSPPFEFKDLLEIAEMEMPDDVFAPLTEEELEDIEKAKEEDIVNVYEEAKEENSGNGDKEAKKESSGSGDEESKEGSGSGGEESKEGSGSGDEESKEGSGSGDEESKEEGSGSGDEESKKEGSGSGDEESKEGSGSGDEESKEGSGSGDEESKEEGSGSGDEDSKEGSGSGDEESKEGSGSGDEESKEGSGSGDEESKEGSGSGDEELKEEGSGSGDEESKEGSGSGDEESKEGSGSGDEELKEGSGSGDEESKEEGSGSGDEESKEEGSGSGDAESKESSGSGDDESKEEGSGSGDEESKEGSGSGDEDSKEEGSGSGDEESKEEGSGSGDEESKEGSGSGDEESKESSGSGDEELKEGSGSGDEESKEEGSGSGDEESKEEGSGSGDEETKESSGSGDEETREQHENHESSEETAGSGPMDSYRLEKEIMKARLEDERQRLLEAQRARKRDIKKQWAAEKQKLKARMEAERRRELQRKQTEMAMFLKEQQLYKMLTAAN